MEDLSLHILDVAENSVDAGATRVEISIEEDAENDLLTIVIADNGKGMDEKTMKTATDPFFTTKTVRRVGLGLPFLKQAAEECAGSFSLASEKGKGTTVKATFRMSHIDRKPLGDVAASVVVLIAGNPDIDIVFAYRRAGLAYLLDTRQFRKELDGVPLNSPEVLKLIRNDIEEGTKG